MSRARNVAGDTASKKLRVCRAGRSYQWRCQSVVELLPRLPFETWDDGSGSQLESSASPVLQRGWRNCQGAGPGYLILIGVIVSLRPLET